MTLMQQSTQIDERPTLVTVVIVNYNGAPLLRQCLQSVFAQPFRPIEVIAVDNASTDDSVSMVQREFPEVRIIANNKNFGFAEANNQGVASARGEYVVLLNNDTVVDPAWLEELLMTVRMPGMGIVTSKVITDGVPVAFYEMNGTVNYVGYNIMRHFVDLSQVFFAGGASLIFRRREFNPPFLKEYFLYHEDVYLSWRARLRGLGISMAQGSIVHHRGSAATRREPSAVISFFQERNRLLNCLLFYETRTLVLLIPYFLADACAKVSMSIVVRRKSLYGILKSYWWLLSHGGWILHERAELQSSRSVPDVSILSFMSTKVIDGDSVVIRLINRISRRYALATGLLSHA
jgi:GT2 family glycosyltransferase